MESQCLRVTERPRQAEIHDDDVAARPAKPDVRRLEVAVQKSDFVGSLQAPGDLAGNADAFLFGNRMIAQTFLQGAPPCRYSITMNGSSDSSWTE